MPGFLALGKTSRSFLRVHLPKVDSRVFHFYLAWNPRLLRLNPHAIRRRDWLVEGLSKQMTLTGMTPSGTPLPKPTASASK
jgi:hypothetical protein